MTTTTTKQDLAIDYLSAFELDHDDDGTCTMWAHVADEDSGHIYTMTRDDLAELAPLQAEYGDSDGYSHWCSGYGSIMDDDAAKALMIAAGSAGDGDMVEICKRHLGWSDEDIVDHEISSLLPSATGIVYERHTCCELGSIADSNAAAVGSPEDILEVLKGLTRLNHEEIWQAFYGWPDMCDCE